jgi:hypothetical protein
MSGDVAPLPPPPASPRPVRVLVAAGVATVVLGFVVGFAIGGRSGDGADTLTAASTVPPTPAPSSTATTPAPSSTQTTSSTTSSTTTTEAPTTTTAPTTVAPTTAVDTTAAPPTTPAPTFAPSRVVVSYATDGGGRLILPRSGSANLVITNEGGLAQQWLVTGTGFTTAGASQGTLAPGQTTTITVVAPREELPSNQIVGVISVLGAVNPTVPFVIPAA